VFAPATPRLVACTSIVEAIVRDLDARDSVAVVIGQEGSGKTSLCMALAASRRACTITSVCFAPGDGRALLEQWVADFAPQTVDSAHDVFSSPDVQEPLTQALETLARTGISIRVVVDDAHRLSQKALLLTATLPALAARYGVGARVVLVADESICATLDSLAAHGVIASAIAAHHLRPLDAPAIEAFISSRWWNANGGLAALRAAARMPQLTRRALRLLTRASRGNARLVCAITDAALASIGDRTPARVTARRVRRACYELGLRRPSSRWAVGAAMGVALACVAGVVIGASARRIRTDASLPRAERAQPARVETRGVESDAHMAPQQSFNEFQRTALPDAQRLVSTPDVLALMQLEETAKGWAADAGAADRDEANALVLQLDALTNEARQRQLAADGEALRRESRTQP
jgi:type II secretory pathway predicted ATPase ExeA